MLGWWRRPLTVVATAVTLVLGTAVAAHAGFGDPVNCTTDPTNPACIIVVADPGGGNDGGDGGSNGCRDSKDRLVPCFIEGKGWWGGDGCYYQRAAGNDLQLAELLGGKIPPPGYWYVGTCGDPLTNWWPAGLTKYRVYGPNPGIDLLAQEAIKHLTLPAPAIHVNPDAAVSQVVFVPTWLWVEPATFTSRSATASVAGLSVTALAKPTKVTWSTGDGDDPVTCAGGGTAWARGTNPAAASPDCGHTYTTTSSAQAGGKFTLRATITWEISWAGGGQTGTEPALTSTSALQVRVAETSVVNTR